MSRSPAGAVDALVDVLVASGALRFGDLTTRSGRPTPYFVDAGRVRTGDAIARLASLYADAIQRDLPAVDVLFGPAYKGIPLAVATAMELARRGQDVGFAFDRKEAKDHGEGGRLVGASLEAGTRVVIVEDVTTAGTSVRATVPLLMSIAPVEVVGLIVAVDRRERGPAGRGSALEELAEEFGLTAVAIATIDDLVERLSVRGGVDGGPLLSTEDLARIADHRARYGAPSSDA
jgi:orotate phosphoribosyltransferase